MTSLNYVEISELAQDGTGSPVTSGSATFTCNTTVYAGGVPVLVPDIPVQAQIIGGQLKNAAGGTLRLLATDNAGISYVGQTGFFFWTVAITAGGVALDPWSFFLPFGTLGAGPVDLYSLANTPAGGGGVGSVFGRTGTVTADTGDYTAAQVGAIPSSAAGADNGVATLDGSGLLPASQLRAATAVTRGGVFLGPNQPWQFHVPAQGGGADDTPALRTAINAALAYMAANQHYAELWLDPVLYTLSSPTLKTSANQGNSQLPLNPVANTMPCGRLVIRSTAGGAVPNPNFQAGSLIQTGAGPVLLSTLTGQSFDGTWGAPSVLGGPTPQQGWGYNSGSPNFSNLMIDVEGVTVMTQGPNPTMIGFDFRGITKMHASGAALVDATLSQMTSTEPTNSWAYGITSPDVGNSDLSDIGTWTSYGYYWGLELSEHANAQRITCIANYAGIALNAGAGQHGFAILYYSAEANQYHVLSYGGSSAPLHIDHMDTEQAAQYGGTGYWIDDTAGTLYGRVGISVLNGISNASFNGCANLEIISYENSSRAVENAPSYTLGTAFQNPWWRHAWITLGSGTTTGILIGPTSAACTTSVGTTTTSPVTFRLPSGWWLNIQGSGKPSVFNAVID